MSLKHNFTQFFRSITGEIRRERAKQLTFIKEVAFTAFTEIVVRSPVDTGLYRSAHDLTIDSQSNFKPETVQASDRRAEALTELGSVKKLRPFRIFITNNLEYAQPLENGHSKQAPQGVYAVTLQLIQGRIASGAIS